MKSPSQFTLGEIEILLIRNLQQLAILECTHLHHALFDLKNYLNEENKLIQSYIPNPAINPPKKPKQERETYHFTLTE